MEKKNLIKHNPPLFPLFLGEAKAQHYHRIEITVRFKIAPKDSQKISLERIIPDYFEEKPLFEGKMFNIGAGKISSQIDSQDLKKLLKTKSAYAFSLRNFKDKPTFEKDLFHWFEAMHKICPIQFIFRDEPDIGQNISPGGHWTHVPSEILRWHEERIFLLPSLIKALDQAEETYQQNEEEKRIFSYCLNALAENSALNVMPFDWENYPKLAGYVGATD